jgi:ectoine hydroxylase-related dioxygenase (phytanoyl-CoA dioxygenase family)
LRAAFDDRLDRGCRGMSQVPLDPAAIASYHERGYLIAPYEIPLELIARARAAIPRYDAGERDGEVTLPDEVAQLTRQHHRGVYLDSYVTLQSAAFAALVRVPWIGAVAAALMGTDVVRVFRDQLVRKAPGTGSEVGWHRDDAYWPMCTSSVMLTAWIPLTDCGAESGTLRVVAGSHRNSGTFKERSFFEAAPLLDTMTATEVPLRVGQVSFHHSSLLHGSGPNRSSGTRIALTLHLQDGENRYRAASENGRRLAHLNDLLCRTGPNGDPDYTDPVVFPVIAGADR